MPCFPNPNRNAVIQLGVAMTLEAAYFDSHLNQSGEGGMFYHFNRETFVLDLQKEEDSEEWNQSEEETDSNIEELDNEEHLQAYEEYREQNYGEHWEYA
jgi:hypothetical protein